MRATDLARPLPVDHGRTFRILRAARRWSVDELAEAMEVGPLVIEEIEKGRSRATTELLERAARASGLPLWFLCLLGADDLSLARLHGSLVGAIGWLTLHLLDPRPEEDARVDLRVPMAVCPRCAERWEGDPTGRDGESARQPRGYRTQPGAA